MRCAGAWLLVCACAMLGAARAQYTPIGSSLGPGVCQTMDIRNWPDSFEKLRNCTVIEGRLSIVLMERYNYSHYQGISFPKLREITGHLIMYRIKGLRSLGQLFPNLAVIRGHQLFKDFALVLFDNEDLQTLGLSSLTNIERGAVRIERNSKLCYVDTINWAAIAPLGGGNNLIRYNNYAPQCGLCPGEGENTPNAKQCPKNSYGQYFCWNSTTCQKICPPECTLSGRTCDDKGMCCDANCLGGCSGHRAEDCFVCRNFSVGYGKDRRCVSVCPSGTYKHYNRRCITEQECRTQPKPLGEDGDNMKEIFGLSNRTYKPLNDTCVFDCPFGYVEELEYGKPTCKRCQGTCIRRCNSGKIDSLESAQRFKGCTHIQGSLEIAIKGGGNVMEELESCLGLVQEIEGQLRVSRSFALVTLSFFKSLRRIQGKVTVQQGQSQSRQSLFIFDNPNLEELWDWKTHGDITIEEGKLFIHFNPKLCYSQIKPLKRMAKDTVFDDLEVSSQSNGDKAACNRDTIDLWVTTRTQRAVILQWKQYCLDDQRQLLGYSVYYTRAPHNVTLYEKRDACQDIWQVDDLSMESIIYNDTAPKTIVQLTFGCKSQLPPLFHLLPRLEPYTRYAAYVKTYTTQADNKGAQSPIIYFSTLPGQPTPPMISDIEPLNPNEMIIRWTKPIIPNGNITSYHILLIWEEDHLEMHSQRDYCTQPMAPLLPERKSKEFYEEREEKKKITLAEKCNCEEKGKAGSIFTADKEAEQLEAIGFENDLQNMIYVKHPKNLNDRPKRSIEPPIASYTHTSEPTPEKNVTIDGYFKVFSVEKPANVTELLVRNLRHYALYTVSVWACRELDPTEMKNKTVINCSAKATKTLRTRGQEKADVVTSLLVEVLQGNKSITGVKITWKPPRVPNGLVLAYNIKHSRVDSDNTVGAATTCVTREVFDKSHMYILRNLASGNYSITVNAVTQAGNGPLSESVHIFIPERPMEAPREWIVGVVVGCVCVLLVLGGAVWYARRGLMPAAEANKLFASVNPEYVSTVYVPDEWEVPRENIELVRELGQGSFGMVYEGIAKDVVKDNPEIRCAVKTVNEHATDRERVEFLNEASVMKAFDTWHVVRLMGVVSRGQPTLVIMELMERGDLKSYLRSHRPDTDGSAPTPVTQTSAGHALGQPPTLQQIKQMAIEIADGMSYLSAKKFVHRDLAARNCMVAGDLTVKVGDFGMTRDIYETDYYRKGSKGLLPVRWMSPESLKDGVFSSSSDVWSFGVVLWEMATLAMQPYQGLSNEQVLRYVVEGGVMERPEHCPDVLYELMRWCWSHRPNARPTFMQLVASLAPHAAPHFKHRSFFHTPAGQDIYNHHQNQDEEEHVEVNVGAASNSGSNLFGVSGRLASWVRDLSSLRSRSPGDDAAAEPLTPSERRALPLKSTSGPNGVLLQAKYTRDPPAASDC